MERWWRFMIGWTMAATRSRKSCAGFAEEEEEVGSGFMNVMRELGCWWRALRRWIPRGMVRACEEVEGLMMGCVRIEGGNWRGRLCRGKEISCTAVQIGCEDGFFGGPRDVFKYSIHLNTFHFRCLSRVSESHMCSLDRNC